MATALLRRHRRGHTLEANRKPHVTAALVAIGRNIMCPCMNPEICRANQFTPVALIDVCGCLYGLPNAETCMFVVFI